MVTLLRVTVAVGLLGLLPLPARTCGFINDAVRLITLTQEIRTTQVVLLARVEKASFEPTPWADLTILRVFRNHPALEGRKVLRLTRYIRPFAESPHLFLVFADVENGKVEPFRGVL